MIKLAVLFGSKACEHDVSIITAVQAMSNLDFTKYEVIPIYIGRDGRWYTGENLFRMETYSSLDVRRLTSCMITLGVSGKAELIRYPFRTGLFAGTPYLNDIDAALLCFHGMNGEDGSVQGLLELYDIPYTSAGVLGSATGMDKIAMKLIYKGCDLPILPMSWFVRSDWEKDKNIVIARLEKEVGYPAFVKPANLGSSIGISKATDRTSLVEGIEIAVRFDKRILVEAGVENPMEINCAAVGYGNNVTPSLCEMPVSWEEFLTFDEKYLRGGKGGGKGGVKGGAKAGMTALARQVPAPIAKEMTKKIQDMTVEIFHTMDLKGVVRVDYMIDPKTDRVYVNEVNTIPGSLAFYLFEPMGMSYRKLLDRMVECAFMAHKEKKASSFSFDSQVLQSAARGLKGTKR